MNTDDGRVEAAAQGWQDASDEGGFYGALRAALAAADAHDAANGVVRVDTRRDDTRTDPRRCVLLEWLHGDGQDEVSHGVDALLAKLDAVWVDAEPVGWVDPQAVMVMQAGGLRGVLLIPQKPDTGTHIGLYAHPPLPSVVTDAMVEAACIAIFGQNQWSRMPVAEATGHWSASRELERVKMRAALTAALGVRG